jgi:hypothetical protein
VTPTPRPLPVVTIAPNPARSGQRVTLDGSASDGYAGEWSQVGDGPALAIDDADMFVASFIAPEVARPTEVRVRMTLSTFGGPTFREFRITILPPDAVRVIVGAVSGPPGGADDVSVALDPLGLPIDRLHHQLGFEPEAAVVDRGDGTPDCDPGLGVGVQAASFEFLPAGCVATHSCDAISAEIVAAQPIVAETVQ